MIPIRILTLLLFLFNPSSSLSSQNDAPFCTQCNKRFANNFTLQRHVVNIHSSDDTDRSAFQCVLCYRKFSTKYSLKRHILTTCPITKGPAKTQPIPSPLHAQPTQMHTMLPTVALLRTSQHPLPHPSTYVHSSHAAYSSPPLPMQPIQVSQHVIPPPPHQPAYVLSSYVAYSSSPLPMQPIQVSQHVIPPPPHQPTYVQSSPLSMQPIPSTAALHISSPQPMYVQLPPQNPTYPSPQLHRQPMHEEQTLQPAPQPLPPLGVSTQQELTELVATLTAKF